MQYLTETEARNRAEENATPLSDLVGPSDIEDGAESWDDIDEETLTQECFRSAEIIVQEKQSPFAGIVHDRKLSLFREDLHRAPMDHLVFDDRETAVRKGYWPHDMDYHELHEILEEIHDDIHHDYEQRARETVMAGIADGMHP